MLNIKFGDCGCNGGVWQVKKTSQDFIPFLSINCDWDEANVNQQLILHYDYYYFGSSNKKSEIILINLTLNGLWMRAADNASNKSKQTLKIV